MSKKDVLRELPQGDYEVTPPVGGEPKQLLKELPKGDYEIQQPKSEIPFITNFGSEGLDTGGDNKFEEIINNIPDLDDSKKQTIRDLALKGVKGEELSNSILTLQGKHPRQSEIDKSTALLTGGLGDILGKTTTKYYFDERGVPKPLKPDERPPKGFEVASIWGTQQEANDDNTITSLGKHLWNGVIGAAEGIVSLPEMAYRATTGEESDLYHKFQNEAESVKFKTPEYENKPLYNIEDLAGIKDYTELFKKDRWMPSMDAVQGAVLGGLETGLSFILGTKGLGVAGKAIGGVGQASGLLKAGTLVDETGQVLNKGSQLTNFIEGTSNAGKLGQAYTTSYVQNYNEAYDAATEAGLEGKDKLAFAGVTTIPLAMLDVAFGTEGLLTQNMLAKNAKKEMFKKLGEGIVKDAKGNITEESLQKLFKESVINGTRLNKSFIKELGGTIAEEGLTEAGQAITLETAKEIYDKVSKDQKFNTEVFSVENMGKYINEALSGGIGAMGIGSYGVSQKRKIDKEQAKNNSAFEIVKNGQVDNFNKNVNLALENGDISKEDADAAKFKVRTYQEYYDQTKKFKLSDDNKKRLFELSFEKENLESQIPTRYEEEKLKPLEQAEIAIKKDEANKIQKEINDILKADIIVNKTTPTAVKVIEEADKHLTPEKPKEGAPKMSGSLKELYERHAGELGSLEEKPVKKEKKPEVVETRTFEEIPFADWNQKRDSQKFKVLSEHLDTTNTTQTGELKLMKGGEGEITNDTVHIKLPNNKWVILASSATDSKTKLRGHLHIENLPKDFDGHKVVIKPTRLTTGRIVLPVYNAETGKHVGYVREDNTGKANEKLFAKRAEKIGADEAAKIQDKEIEELQHLKTVKLTKNEIEATNRPISENKPSVEKVTLKTEKTQPETKEIVESTSKEEFIADRLEALKANEDADYDPTLEPLYTKAFGEQYDKQNRPAEGDTITQEESTARDNKEISGEVKEVSSKKPRTIRKGTKRANQKITDPIRVKALEIESDKPYDIVEQYFIKNGSVKFGEIYKLFKGSKKESNKRFSLQNNNAPTLKALADDLWTSYSDLGYGDRYTSMDFYNAIEEVLKNFNSRTDMANDLVKRWEVKIDPREQMISDELSKAENQGVDDRMNEIISEGEKLGNDEITKISESQDEFDIWGNKIIDIIRRKEGDEDVFQKESKIGGKIEDVVEVIKQSFPKINVVLDESIDGTGKVSSDGKTLSINPYKAGRDTPIHEGGHILIDAIGYDNSIIQKAVKQLKETDFYKEVKANRPELSGIKLDKEVLAEAIGREGAGIFDTEVKKNIFMKYLDYIFNRLKQLLGIDKNIAKSLAKQIIGGIGTKNLEGTQTGEEQFQKESEEEKPKKKFKAFEEKSREQQIKALTLSFEQYSEQALKYDPIADADYINEVNDRLESDELTERERDIWEAVKAELQARKKEALKAWFQYREDVKEGIDIKEEARELEDAFKSKEISEEEFNEGLIDLYNRISGFQKFARETAEKNIMNTLAYRMFRLGKENAKKNEHFVEEVANKADVGKLGVKLMNLGHASEKIPELQVFSKDVFEPAVMDMTTETREKKNTYEKLGTAVIREVNKKLGIIGKAQSLYSSDSAKYFDYMDDGQGNLITVSEAESKRLSEAQINFLKYQRELIAEMQGMVNDPSVYNMPMQVLKIDPTFQEAYKADGILQAFSNFLGTSYNIKQVRIEYTNPNTGKSETTEFGNIEKELLNYGKKGVKERAKALALLLKYNLKAKRQLKKGVNVDEKENPLLVKNNSQYSLDYNGRLSSKFDKPRDKNRGYSKDFYRAGIDFIDDMMHVKHMSKLVPIINSIEHLNKEGYLEHEAKPNVAKWVQEWRDLHLFKNPVETTPEIDVALRFIRNLTSATTMMYNIPASALNLFMGVYNNWRAENTEKMVTGHARLFGKLGKHKPTKDYAFGAINPYAIDILRKFHVVSTDLDSNPKTNVAKFFTELGHALTRYGEFQIQGSMFLGLMTKEEYDSFEYKKNKQGIDELVFKDNISKEKQKELKDKFIAYKNRVSDIQGKYSDKDRRNIMNGELGKAAFQFKVWMPDWFKERFGGRYIDANGKTREGSWTTVFNGGLSELKKQIKENGGYAKGVKNTFFTNEENKSLEAKNILSNIKGLMAVAFFWALAHQDDDDDKKRKTALDAQNALSQMLFIFDPNTLKWTVTRPVAALGTVEKMINVVEDIKNHEAKKAGKDIMKLVPANKVLKIKETVEDLTK